MWLCRKYTGSLNINWHFIYDLLVKVVPFPSVKSLSAYNGTVVEKYHFAIRRGREGFKW